MEELIKQTDSVYMTETLFDGQAEQGVELDHVLPDYYPEIFKIIKCITTPRIVSCSVNGDKLNYDISVSVRVLYCAEESDMSEEFVKNHEENAVYSHIINVPIGHRFPGVDTEEIMTPEKLFMIQAHVIHELAAENESCIFVGRCADVVLKDHENCYSFFIHSPVEERIKRIVETEHVTERQAKKMIKQTDWERSSYHNYYTKQKWGDPGNYDLMINSAISFNERFSFSYVPLLSPLRITVILSLILFTSFSLCDMNIIVCPNFFSCFSSSNKVSVS